MSEPGLIKEYDNTDIKELICSVNRLVDIIKEQNEKTNSAVNIHERSIKYYLKRYIQEITEASFGLFSVSLITGREFTLNEFVKIVCIIGLITLILEEYNFEYSNNFKQGIHFTLGSVAFNN